MHSEVEKQKETINFLDAHLLSTIDESKKQHEVISMQGEKLHEIQKELRKVEDVVRLQAKLLSDKNQKSKEFDEELYLFELYKYGTVHAYGKLASQTSVSYTINSAKNRKRVREFREKIENLYIIKKVSNGTIALVDYDEAKRLLKFTKE